MNKIISIPITFYKINSEKKRRAIKYRNISCFILFSFHGEDKSMFLFGKKYFMKESSISFMAYNPATLL